jgi:hypothetical protein
MTPTTFAEPPSPSLIASFMPAFSIRQADRVAVAASPDHAYAAARTLDMSQVAFVRWLFQLRILPDRIAAAFRGRSYPALRASGIDDITRAGSGFLLLGEEPGREVVVGAVGKFWQPAIEYAAVTPAGFTAFDRPGFGKLAWCIRVDPREGGGSWVGFELRVGATDPASLARFKRYWWIIGRFSHAIRRSFLGKLVAELGPAGSDERRSLPGDEILAASRVQKTHGVTIEAPVASVWPWLVQIGARRAGWYSYDLLDNGGTHSAERIVPELQHLYVGKMIPALPTSPDGFAVLRLEPERALVLGDPGLLPGAARSGGPPWQTTWAFVLAPIGETATRLTVRARADFPPAWTMAVVRPLLGLAHEVMERRQLHNLRRRAEAMA